MEENQNSGVDLSNYWESTPKKKAVAGKLSREDQKKRTKKFYLIIIVVCIATMAVLWIYYFIDSQAAY
ncbi:MAG: hypothetical protein MUD10_02460 [Candidatus Pacebacteria bacterium]|jgi:hypothetical protein|nr:hypothetical protein [Candidatus Paceibacterota bacterium]